jgi:hypothetical protein
MTKNAPFQVLAPVSTGIWPCALCGRGGADVRIMHRSHVDSWHHRCAQEYFQASAGADGRFRAPDHLVPINSTNA